ncbi:MAG TPA: tubulin-like doman-containing protein [Planctomycetota bacterium]|nr:tubulin-like doman-containing protein [Planctomycetota bacterium]
MSDKKVEPANILVGCGGSGIKTLIRLTALLSEDAEWRYRINNDVYYMAVDTEEDEVANFASNIRRCLGHGMDPVVEPVFLSQATNSLQPLVNRHFIDPFTGGQNPKAAERLYEHWWNQGVGKPFKASKVSPLTDGAGQCPPISYFLAWEKLGGLNNRLNMLMEKIKERRIGRPLEKINVVIVGSLAGGTGRGCWQLLAFKIRQYLQRYTSDAISTTAFLFDATVFEELAAPNSDQMDRMMINALTGFSELSTWVNMAALETQGKSSGFVYRLPSMESPEDEDTDVLIVNKRDDERSVAPVNNAFLIFDESQNTALSKQDQFFEMAGTALYAALSESAIKAEKVNKVKPYVSVGTATFEVPASSLRRYFETRNRMRAARELADLRPEPKKKVVAEPVEGEQTHPKKTQQEIVQQKLATFFSETGLDLELSTPSSAIRAKENGSFLQRVLSELSNLYKPTSQQLLTAARAQDKEEVLSKAKEYESPSPTDVNRAFDSLLKDQEKPEVLLVPHLESVFLDTQSVGGVVEFLKRLEAHLEGTLKALPRKEKVTMIDNDTLRGTATRLSKRPYIIFGKRFDEGEIEELADAVERAVVVANYEHVRQRMEKYINQWLSAVSKLEAAAEQVQKLARKLVKNFENELQHDHNELFSDPERPEKGYEGNAFTRDRFYKRVIKPVLKEDAVEAMLPEEKFKEAVTLLINGVWTDPSAVGSEKASDKFKEELQKRVSETVSLEHNFVNEHFGIYGVVDKLRDAWQERLRKAAGRKDEQAKLLEILSFHFGVEPRTEDGELKLPPVDRFLLAMCASLVTGCMPFWRLKPDSKGKEKHQVKLFPPRGLSEDEQSEAIIREKMKKNAGSETEFLVAPKNKRRANADGSYGNDFMILAYVTEEVDELEEIESLTYWRDHPRVKKWLAYCEREDGHSIFTPEDSNRGIGYISPIYVRNSVVREARWRPWNELIRRTADSEEQQTIDALLYALMPLPQQYATKLEEVGWMLPLIKETEKERFVFTRRAYTWEDGRAETDNTSPWKPNTLASQSICKVLDVLSGKRAAGGKDDAKVWRTRILEESRAFWSDVADACGFAPRSEASRKVLKQYQDWLATQEEKSSGEDHAVWRALIQRADELRKVAQQR